METLRFWLNDALIEEDALPPTLTLLRYLRDRAHLTGTKEGCAEGDCGACTVVVLESRADGARGYRSECACLLLLPMVQGKRVYTVEGLRRTDEPDPHPVQRAMVEALASQCGYCTPGVTMALFEACYRDDLDEPWKLDAALCGNLCRCTGYRPIRDAAARVAGSVPRDRFLRTLAEHDVTSPRLAYRSRGQAYFTPASLSELFDLLDAEPDARIVAGGTDLALEITKRDSEPRVLVSLEALPELRWAMETPDGFRLGAARPLTELETFSRFTLPSIERMLRYFGSRQIKNRATLGGNLCTASPIGDLAPVLLSLGAEVILLSRRGERRVPIDQFFLAYRKTALERGEIVGFVDVPRPDTAARVAAYKVSKRRELDISTVAAGFFVLVDEHGRVARARFGFGGMAATPSRAPRTEAALLGEDWTEDRIDRAATALEEDFQPISDHRGSAAYRMLVARNLLRGFFLETRDALVPRLPDRPVSTVIVE